ncbi:hypothetical protein ABT278_42150, partial [Streptomyces sp. NPDC001228]|uniref:hypothetical protein n=1 Tax=Streptomyces sp. NPDC001228 TaxID=3154381 RepID=UPI00331776C0
HVLNKSPEVVRVYLPPDANTLLSVADHVLRSRLQGRGELREKRPPARGRTATRSPVLVGARGTAREAPTGPRQNS